MTDAPLNNLRQEIDAIDQEIIALLKRRMDVVERVIETKKQHDIPVRIDDRIKAVIEGREATAQAEGMPAGFVRAVYEAIVEQTCRYEEGYLE